MIWVIVAALALLIAVCIYQIRDLTIRGRDPGAITAEIVIEDPYCPVLKFRNCRNLIRCLPLLQYDARRPSDAANEPHEITHGPDALRGFCVFWTQAGAGTAAPQRRRKWTADMREDYRNADSAGRELLRRRWGPPD